MKETGGSLISVTQALSVINQSYGPNENVIEIAAIRGSLVHSACAAYALGLFPMSNEETEGYFQSFKNWFDAHVCRVAMEPEQELKDEKLGLVGHMDLGHLILNDGRNVLLDIKTPVQYRSSWSLQLAAYWHLVKLATNLTIIKPGVLMLDPDGGTAKVKWVEEEEKMSMDQLFSLFMQALNLFKFMNNGKGGGK
jgi:hypothetical protein